MDVALHLVPTFLELAQNLNISRSAERLGLSQPALSRQLRSLEEQLGVSLFIRQSRGLVLTQAGRQLKRELEPAFETIRHSLASSRNTALAIEGPVVFGCLAELGQKVFAPLLFEFAKLHPGVTLDIRLMTEREIAREVAEGQLGLGVATRLPSGEAVRAHRLMTERVVVLTGARNPHDLDEHPAPQFVGYRGHDPLLHAFMRHFPVEKSPPPARISVAVNSHASMLNAIEELSFYAVLPIRSAIPAIETGKVRIASKNELRNEVFLVLPDHEFQERRYTEVTRFLIRKAREVEHRELKAGTRRGKRMER